MQRWVVLAVLAVMVLPARAMAADCAATGIPGQYDVFAEEGFTGVNAQTQGPVAAGSDVFLKSFYVGQSLPSDPTRVDLVVGGDLTVDPAGAGVWRGGVTYAGTLTPSGWNSTLSLRKAPPPFDFGEQFATLRKRSAQWAGLPAKVVKQPPVQLTLAGTDPTRNVFTIAAEDLETVRQVAINVPAGSTTLINVTGTSGYTNALSSVSLTGATPATVLWNFPLATSVTSTVGFEWKGSILAPNAAVSLSNGQLSGSLAARVATVGASNGGYLVNHIGFTGCLPPLPPPEPQRDLSLKSLCTDPLTLRHALVLTNNDPTEYLVRWEDTGSGLSGTVTAPANSDTFFDIPDGDEAHRIVATSGPTTVEATTGTNKCRGTIVVGKVVTGEGVPPPGPWAITVKGSNTFSKTVALVAGAQATLKVPGRYQPGSVDIGEIAGGYDYTVTEPDPLGARASVDPTLVTITNGQTRTFTVTNRYDPVPPDPPDPPVPPQPPLPPGPPEPLPGPDLVLAASLAGGADLTVAAVVSPRISSVGDVVSVVVRVRNNGPLPAVNALAREIPQVDPRHPNQVAKILSVKAGTRAAGCTSERPVSCGGATLPVGAQAVIRVRARMLVGGAYKSVVVATSLTPDPNTTNNVSVNGLVVTRPSRVAVGVHAPAVARVGEPVSYRVVARGTGSDGAESVRFCHRPPARLLMTSAPGTFRYRGRVCRDVSRLTRGQRASFVVNAIPASSAGGRTLPLRATASAPDARTAVGRDRIAVIAQVFAGTG
jgi:choice-of-anchor A domain-containing protein